MRSRCVSLVILIILILNVFSISLQISPANAIGDFNIDAVGDWGCTSNTDNTVDAIQGRNPELVLGLGDYSYHTTATCWLNAIQPIDSITKINIGNHDDEPSEDIGTYMSHFGLSSPFYSYNYQNVHILTMATNSSYLPGSPQYNFVVNDLQTASQDSNIKWIIVNFHKPMYTSPGACCGVIASFRNTYHSLFDQYGVDLVLNGHAHSYQRTYPLQYNAGSPSNPTITDSNPGEYVNPPGEIFATVGTGGISFHPLSGKASFVSFQQDNLFGALDIQITNNGNKLVGKYFANNGNKLDEFSITKSVSGGYNYAPSFSATGSNFFDVPSTPSLQLSQFSVASWFKTSSDFTTDVTIVNKGGFGSETAGQNMNYGIWMNSAEKVKGGFESSTGTDFYVTSPNSYADNQWHYAVVTYDGTTVKLYIDGVLVGSKSTSGASPDKAGTQPVRIAANSRTTQPTANFFIGDVDEVRVWNDDLTATEQANAFAGTTFDIGEQVLYLDFSSGGSYNYAPSFAATGSNFFDVASSPSLQLSQLSVAAWFKTSANFATDVMIANKGGLGSETAGQNMNYGIWMNSAEKIKGGFESSTGTDFYVTSPNSYADNQWHYAVVTYDGSTVKLYIDGVLVGSKSTSGASPDSGGTQPVRVAANSRTTPPTANFFVGDVDEVRVWNDDLTLQQVSDAFAGTSFNTAEQVLYLDFTNVQYLSGTYIFGPSLTLSGP